MTIEYNQRALEACDAIVHSKLTAVGNQLFLQWLKQAVERMN